VTYEVVVNITVNEPVPGQQAVPGQEVLTVWTTVPHNLIKEVIDGEGTAASLAEIVAGDVQERLTALLSNVPEDVVGRVEASQGE